MSKRQGYLGAIRAMLENARGQGGIGGLAAETFDQMGPRCSFPGCNKPVLVPMQCIFCGHYGCENHSLYHYTKFTVCFNCLKANGMEIALEGDEEAELAGEADQFPWATLGIAPTRDTKEIVRAFRNKAGRCHPDKGGSNAAFSFLVGAKDEALRIAADGY